MRDCYKGVKRVYADGAYDTRICREVLDELGIEDVIPPRKTGKIHAEKGLRNRNKAIMEIAGLNGDYELWKKLKGYGRRSLVETFFSRLKTVLGDRLASRKYNHQQLEGLLRMHVLNMMIRKA